jgi:hypothetical protein
MNIQNMQFQSQILELENQIKVLQRSVSEKEQLISSKEESLKTLSQINSSIQSKLEVEAKEALFILETKFQKERFEVA